MSSVSGFFNKASKFFNEKAATIALSATVALGTAACAGMPMSAQDARTIGGGAGALLGAVVVDSMGRHGYRGYVRDGAVIGATTAIGVGLGGAAAAAQGNCVERSSTTASTGYNGGRVTDRSGGVVVTRECEQRQGYRGTPSVNSGGRYVDIPLLSPVR
ncbi:MAG: hypothetical protein H6854_00450 [Rhodospirillales bacterium]|nr:hypothetical protein [Rhodospirillales bacterium]